MLFLHTLLLFFLLGITPSMAVVLPLGSRDVANIRDDRHLLQGYWRHQGVGKELIINNIIHFNSRGALDFSYSRVRPGAESKEGDFHTGVYEPVSRRMFDDYLKEEDGCPDFTELSPIRQLKITHDAIILGVGNKWERGEFLIEAVDKPKMILKVVHNTW
ncbi:hypothetical protein AX14_002769 [Amanita brunnescens Koide BX004]|nr:hypothetical protein AX14_002769 [Amanita brunnescens Koide BX004]